MLLVVRVSFLLFNTVVRGNTVKAIAHFSVFIEAPGFNVFLKQPEIVACYGLLPVTISNPEKQKNISGMVYTGTPIYTPGWGEGV